MRRLIILAIMAAASASAGAVTTRDYVHDGLIAHWDARFSGGGTGAWTDLVGGRSFELHGVTRSAGKLVFSGTVDSYAFLSAADTAAVFEGHPNLTFEIVAKFPNSDNGGLFKSSAASGVAVRFVDGNRFFCCGSTRPRFQNYSFKGKQITLAVTYTDALSQSCYANATVVGPNSSVGGSCSGDFGGTYLGQMGNGSQPFNGEVYAIRVYDRHLTAEEVAKNAALDAEWLFAGIASDYVRVEASPRRAGVPTPDYGLIENLSAGDPIELTAPSEETSPTDVTRFSCTGWTFEGVDSVRLSGLTKTASFAFAESGVFKWLFDVEHRVVVTSPVAGGTASPADTWVASGEAVTLTATPNAGSSFYCWRDANGAIVSQENPLVLTVNDPVALTPVFLSGSLDPDEVPNFAVRTSGMSAAKPLDLSSVWLPTDRTPVEIAYSSVGWDLAEGSAANATVDLELAQVGGSGRVVLASGLKGRETFVWTPDTVERTDYELSHLVKVSGSSDGAQTLTAHFSFENLVDEKASDAEILAAVRAEVSQRFALENNGGDEEVRWEPVGGAGEGLVAPFAEDGPNPGVSALEVGVSGPGRLVFAVRLAGGTLTVKVDGALRQTIAAAADWTEASVDILTRGEHLVTLEASVSAADQAFVKNLCWQQEDLSLGADVGDPVRVDLREGVRAVSDRAELMPFVYSHTNFVGVAGATAASVARVSVVRLAPDFPTDDLSLWTNAVAGTERVLCREAGESSVVWRGKQGVWKAVFDILSGDDAVHTETAIFDMREFRPGFMLILR